MKKIFAVLAFVAMTLTASAQLKTFDGKLFSCQYPADFEAQEQWLDEAFNAKGTDEVGFLSVSLTDIDMTTEQLKRWADGMKMLTESSFGEPTGWKSGATVLKGNMVSFRAEGPVEVDEEKVTAVKYIYCFVTPQKKCFSGEMKFKKSDEAKYKPLFDKILTSCKEK